MKKYFAVCLVSFFGVLSKVQADPQTEQQAVTKAQIIRKFPGIKRRLTSKYFDVIYPLFAHLPEDFDQNNLKPFVDELKKYPIEFFKGSAESAQFLIKIERAVPQIVAIIKALHEIPEDQRDKVAKAAAKVIKDQSSSNYIIGTMRIVEVLQGLSEISTISTERQEEVLKNTLSFIRPGDWTERIAEGTERHRSIKKALLVSKSTLQGEKGKLLLPLIKKSMDADDVLKVHQAVFQILENEREDVVYWTKILIKKLIDCPGDSKWRKYGVLKKSIDGLDVCHILKKVSQLKKGKRKLVVQRLGVIAKDLVVFEQERGWWHDYRKKLNIPAIEDAFERLPKIPENQWKEIAGYVKPLVNMERRVSILKIFESILSIPQDQRADVIEKSEKFTHKKVSADDVLAIYRVVSRIPQDQWEEIVRYSEPLVSRAKWGSALGIYSSILSIPQDQRADVIEKSKKFTHKKMSADKILEIYQAVLNIPKGQRDNIIKKLEKDLDAGQRRLFETQYILKQFSKILQDQRADIVEKSEKFIRDETSVHEILKIYQVIFSIPRDQQEIVITQAERVINGSTDLERIKNVLDLMSLTPPTQREDVAEMLASQEGYFDVYNRGFSFFDTEQERAVFAQHVLVGYVAAQVELTEGGQIDFPSIVSRVRNSVTMWIAEESRDFYKGWAYEIHNAAKVRVTHDGQSVVGYQAIEHIFKSLGVQRMPLRACIKEMREISVGLDVDEAITRKGVTSQDVNKALSAAYYPLEGKQELAYVSMATPLLGYVWPYMQTLSEEIQLDWLRLAVSESRNAYGQGDWSCPKGIQERLTITGFLPSLEGVDERLIGISTLATSVATEFYGILQAGLNNLAREQYQGILALDSLTDESVRELFGHALEGYARQHAALQVEGLDLVNDFATNDFLKKKAEDFVDAYVESGDEKLEELQALATEKLKELGAVSSGPAETEDDDADEEPRV